MNITSEIQALALADGKALIVNHIENKPHTFIEEDLEVREDYIYLKMAVKLEDGTIKPYGFSYDEDDLKELVEEKN
jgi:hypothetical protein